MSTYEDGFKAAKDQCLTILQGKIEEYTSLNKHFKDTGRQGVDKSISEAQLKVLTKAYDRIAREVNHVDKE